MLVHLYNWNCSCCHKHKENIIIDIPIEEVKLSPFAVACECGYFYKAEHYPVLFSEWGKASYTLNRLKEDIAKSEKDVQNSEKDSITEDIHKSMLEKAKKELENFNTKFGDLSIPIPDHLWVYKD